MKLVVSVIMLAFFAWFSATPCMSAPTMHANVSPGGKPVPSVEIKPAVPPIPEPGSQISPKFWYAWMKADTVSIPSRTYTAKCNHILF